MATPANRRRNKRRGKGYKDHGVVEGPITVSGETQNIRVERPTLEIDREVGTNLRLRRGEGGTDRLIVEAGGARARPEPEQPRSFYDFELLVGRLDRNLAHILNPEGISRLNMNEKQAKFQSRFFKGGILTKIGKPDRFSAKWLLFHPGQIVEKMFERSVGRGAFRRNKKALAKANILRRKYGPHAETLVRRFVADSVETVRALYRETNSGQITWENRNGRLNQYKAMLKIVKGNYQHAVRVLEKAYMDESRGKATVRVTNNGVVVQKLGKLGRRLGDPATINFYPDRAPGRGGQRIIELGPDGPRAAAA